MQNFDLIVFGASGFTGQQTAKFINRFAAGDGLSWALAGRDKTKLEQQVIEHGLQCDGVLVADALDKASVEAMVNRTKAIINLAGPYALYGENVIAACAKHGVHYADLSGELLYVRKMMDRYHSIAEKSGAKIIPVCGYEALPFDLGSLSASEKFKGQHGKAPKRVRSVTQFHFSGKMIYPSDALSGGTWGSGVEMFKSDTVEGVTDPQLLIEGDRSWLPAESRSYGLLKNAFPKGEGWLAPVLPQPWLNPAVIYRTQQILGADKTNDGYVYREGMDTSGYVPGDQLLKPAAAISMALGAEISDRLMQVPVKLPRQLLGQAMAIIGPKPGEGPKPERLDLWSYTSRFTASDDNGNSNTTTVTGEGQPGYKSTADIIGQVGRLLASNDVRLPTRSGILTPATGLGLDVLESFADARLYFD